MRILGILVAGNVVVAIKDSFAEEAVNCLIRRAESRNNISPPHHFSFIFKKKNKKKNVFLNILILCHQILQLTNVTRKHSQDPYLVFM